MTKIIVGVDGSEASLEALRKARYLAEPLNAQIEAVGCWEFPRMYDGYLMTDIGGGIRENAAKVLNQAVTTVFGAATPTNVKINLIQGDPKSALIKASQNADLLMVGRRGHGGFRGLLIGSVSSACVAHAKCPVMVVHAPEDGEHGS